MDEIRLLTPQDFDAWIDIVANAYPGWKIASSEDRERVKQRLLKVSEENPTVHFYGLFREGQLLGGMRLHDFTMNCLGIRMVAGGVGLIAVHFLHKKEHVARDMVAYFLRHYRQQGTPLAMLYPFRPDFYHDMGFGFGTKMDQYRLRPAALPKGTSKEHVRFAGEGDARMLLDCYHRYAIKTHGMIERSEREMAEMLKNPGQRVVTYEEYGELRGYMVLAFAPGESFLLNDIEVRELIYESPEALQELLTFLRSQADQIRYIIIGTQDAFFHHLLTDPRREQGSLIPSVYHESNLQGVGLMYRVSDVAGMFARLADRNFGGQTCRLQLTVDDSFLPENAGSTLLHFHDGRLSLADSGAYDVAIRLSIADFSSLLMGTINFRSLYRYGLADISEAGYVPTVDRIFAVETKPVCMTPF